MAAPHASAIAALILSVNPSLTDKEAVDIIEKTSMKAGGYNYTNHSGRTNGTWNNEMGYGICNAYAAVLAAKENGKVISYTDKTVSSNQTISGWAILAKNVTVTNNALLAFMVQNEITIDAPFAVNRGAQLIFTIK